MDAAKTDKSKDSAPRTRRRKVYYSAILHIRALSMRCRVRDISVTGALIETTVPLWAGAPCHVTLPKIGDAHGTLVWCDGPRSGMSFEPPLDEALLATLTVQPAPERVESHASEAAWRKPKDVAAAGSQDRARNAVSWLRSKTPQR